MKKILGFVAALSVFAAMALSVHANEAPTVIVDERELVFVDQGPVIVEETGRTLIPIRFVLESAGARVRAHEQEHVSNAYKKATQNNGKVINASVSIHTAICSECGRTYVSGGTTNTTIKYSNEENPYQKERKAQDAFRLIGANIDYVA